MKHELATSDTTFASNNYCTEERERERVTNRTRDRERYKIERDRDRIKYCTKKRHR